MNSMTKISEIYSLINQFAPFDTQLSFDNAGLLIGNADDCVTKIAISLDATPDTVKTAYENGANLLITHHPVIFGSLKSISKYDAAYHAIRLGVSVISAHTNLDAAVGGVNDCLCMAIDLCNIKPLSSDDDVVPLARIGDIKDSNYMSSADFGELLKKSIKCGGIKLTATDNQIKRVAVCGGSGGDYIIAAKNSGADALVTGECSHHHRLLAKQLGITLFECGHFCTEQTVKAKLYEIIKPICNNVFIIDETDPAIYI